MTRLRQTIAKRLKEAQNSAAMDSTPVCRSWPASGEGPLNRSGSPESGVVFTPSAPTPSFCNVPWKLGRIPNTPIEPVIVDGSAKMMSPVVATQ